MDRVLAVGAVAAVTGGLLVPAGDASVLVDTRSDLPTFLARFAPVRRRMAWRFKRKVFLGWLGSIFAEILAARQPGAGAPSRAGMGR